MSVEFDKYVVFQEAKTAAVANQLSDRGWTLLHIGPVIHQVMQDGRSVNMQNTVYIFGKTEKRAD